MESQVEVMHIAKSPLMPHISTFHRYLRGWSGYDPPTWMYRDIEVWMQVNGLAMEGFCKAYLNLFISLSPLHHKRGSFMQGDHLFPATSNPSAACKAAVDNPLYLNHIWQHSCGCDGAGGVKRCLPIHMSLFSGLC